MSEEAMMSNQIDQLAGALSKCQTSVLAAIKDATNPFLKNKYADLASVWASCRDALGKEGLAIVQGGVLLSDGWAIRTTLLHSSGQWIQRDCKLIHGPQKGINEMQSLGIAITYCRRYGLSAMVGVVQEDDDGNGAGQRHGERDEQDQRPEPQPDPQEAFNKGVAEWKALITAKSDPVMLGGLLAHLTTKPKNLVDAVMPHFLQHIKALGFALKPGTFEIVHADSFSQELSQCSDLNQMNALFKSKVLGESDKKLATSRYNEMLTYAGKCAWTYNKDAKAFEAKQVAPAREPSHDELAAEAKAMGW